MLNSRYLEENRNNFCCGSLIGFKCLLTWSTCLKTELSSLTFQAQLVRFLNSFSLSPELTIEYQCEVVKRKVLGCKI